MKIVIVEDESLTAFSFKKLLLDHQHDVVGLATRASAAIEIIEELQPDLVIVDINLKDSNPKHSKTNMNGIDVCRWIKSRSKARVLAVSAYISTPGMKEDLEAAGVDRYLSKPVSDSNLLEATNSLSLNEN